MADRKTVSVEGLVRNIHLGHSLFQSHLVGRMDVPWGAIQVGASRWIHTKVRLGVLYFQTPGAFSSIFYTKLHRPPAAGTAHCVTLILSCPRLL